MDISQFDFYIDRAINGEYLSQTKKFKCDRKNWRKYYILLTNFWKRSNWSKLGKLLYYFYVSGGSLLDLCILIETRCKFYDPKTYRLAKNMR